MTENEIHTLDGSGGDAVCFNNRQDPVVSGAVANPLGAKDNGHGIITYQKNVGALNAGAWRGVMRNQAMTEDKAIVTQVGVRRLTPTECERLQGFPDGWTEGFADSTRYKMLGNAVAVPCVEWIGKRITQQLPPALGD